MNDNDPLNFAIARYLETLLSLYYVQVENNGGIAGTTFLNADPLDSVYKGDTL